MIKINLLTAERRVTKKKLAFGSAQLITVGCGGILLAALLACGWRFYAVAADNSQLDRDLATATKEAASLHGVIAQLQDFEQRRTKLQQRVGLIEQLRAEQRGPVHMLDQISRALPQMVWLTEIKQAPGSNDVTIDGRTTSITSVSDFASALEGTGYFKKSVEIVSSTTQPGTTKDGPGDLVAFQLKATFQVPGAAKPGAAAAAAAKPKSGN
ncbi:MAG TPA: PilN domain-containing protein [Vicinamibacterales bacterium]|jgi:type IV pilus assembly protein PilN